MHSESLAAPESEDQPFEALVRMVERSRKLVVLTGAGCSTDSGIPDYRDGQGAWKRTPPMQFQEFVASHAARQRYWARALLGWRHFRDVQPNRAHHVLAALERSGPVFGVITQNVDGLHERAGSVNVIDLHGRIDTVECLQCGQLCTRENIQAQLQQLNPEWTALNAAMAPDGDALLDGVDFGGFRLTDCAACAGVLKPAVVFFGETVPRAKVSAAFAAIEKADALLVVGSSLMVYSGYRFVRAARARGLPIAIVNLGATRADAYVDIKVPASCSEVLSRLQQRIFGPTYAESAAENP